MFTPILFFILTIQFGYAVSNQNSTNETGLPWPLPDLNTESMLLVHGVHCNNVMTRCLKDQNNKNNETIITLAFQQEMDTMHCYHCQRLIQLVKRFIDANPDFSVSDDLCSIILKPRYRRAGTTEKAGTMGKGSAKAGTMRKGRIEADMAKAYVYKRELDGPSLNPTNDKEYVELEAWNLGNLLLKDYKGMPLTQPEAEYMLQIEGEDSVLGAARGLYCELGSAVAKERIDDVVKISHGICW